MILPLDSFSPQIAYSESSMSICGEKESSGKIIEFGLQSEFCNWLLCPTGAEFAQEGFFKPGWDLIGFHFERFAISNFCKPNMLVG